MQEGADQVNSDVMNWFGHHEKEQPGGVDAVPRGGHSASPVLDHTRLHRRTSQKGPSLERQDLLAIGRRALPHERWGFSRKVQYGQGETVKLG